MFIPRLLMDPMSSWADNTSRKEEFGCIIFWTECLSMNDLEMQACSLLSVFRLPSLPIWKKWTCCSLCFFSSVDIHCQEREDTRREREKENLKCFSSSSAFLFISSLLPSQLFSYTFNSSSCNETDIPVTARLHCHFLVSSSCSIQWRDKNLLRVEKWKMKHLLPAFKTITQV